MPALLILAIISWLLGSGKKRSKAEDVPLFTALERRPRRPLSAFVVSVAAHAFCLVLVVALSDIFAISDDDFLPRQIASRALIIKLPDRLYLARAAGQTFPATARRERAPRLSVRRRDLNKYAQGAAEPKSLEAPSPALGNTTQSLFSVMAPPAPPPHAEPRQFELPDMPVRETATQTLLQAELPPNLPPKLDQRLPQLLFWDAETRDPKIPPPERPIVPGNLTAKLETPNLNATPRLEAPLREIATADVRLESSTSSTGRALTLPPATTMPLRILSPVEKPISPASIDPFTGQPVHILALSPDPAPLTDALKSLFIPAGNQLARLPGAPPLFGFPGLNDGSGNAGSATWNSEPVDDGDLGGGASADAGLAEVLHSFPGDGRVFGLLTPPGLTGTPLRVVHPGNGVFDVVVVQSSGAEAFPEATAVLSGRPIYTVYLQVGAPKEWILQYCVPNMARPIQTGNFVSLGNPAPVGAPYPMVTIRPPEDWQHGSEYLLIHGFLDEAGRLRNLTMLSNRQPASPTTGAILDYLAYWEFRPAVVDGRPVKVEVILAVPPDQVT
ncbi:MAG: hypothetical protein JWO48_2795 [Bryobacterales bacterium]|nr:hypothetical protein [Bryobacterales bacterium]